jgi:hypothetical protein
MESEEIHDLLSSSNITRVMKSESMGWERHLARRGRGEIHTGFWCGNLTERDRVDALHVDGKIILEWILKKGMIWHRLACLRMMTKDTIM